MVRLVSEHEMHWYVPKKPSVSVRVHDAASGERVIGIRYHVMTRPHGAPVPQHRVSFGGTLVLDTAGKVCIVSLAVSAALSCPRAQHCSPLEILWHVLQRVVTHWAHGAVRNCNDVL
jgi:hypothetical protein